MFSRWSIQDKKMILILSACNSKEPRTEAQASETNLRLGEEWQGRDGTSPSILAWIHKINNLQRISGTAKCI